MRSFLLSFSTAHDGWHSRSTDPAFQSKRAPDTHTHTHTHTHTVGTAMADQNLFAPPRNGSSNVLGRSLMFKECLNFPSFGQTLFDTSVSLSIIKTEPMRIGWGTWGSVFDFGWSNSCNQARIQITATYGRSMESYLYHGIERTVEGFSKALAQNPPLDMWIYCSGTVYEINHKW
jgi:hypothetical protein